MGFARGFDTGARWGNTIAEAYLQSKDAEEYSRIHSEKPVSYMEEDTAQMEAMASARKPDGTPYYSINQNPDGTRGYVPNFEYEGMPTKAAASSRPVAPVVVDPKVGTLRQGQADTLQQPQEALAPQAMAAPMRERHRFMGKDYDKAPTEREQLRAKTLAYSDVMGKRDPKGAMGMRREQSQMDMAEEQHDWKKQDAQFTQNERAKAEKLRTGWQEEYKRLTTLMQEKGPKALADEVGGWFSKDGSGIPMMMTFNESDGRLYMSSQIPGMEGVTALSPVEALTFAQGLYEAGNGDPQVGLRTVMAIEQAKKNEVRQTARDNNANVQAIAGQANVLRDDARQDKQVDYNIMSGDRKHALDVDQFGHRKNVDNARIGIERSGLGLRQQEAIDRRYDANRRYDLDVRNTNIREFTAADTAAHRQVALEREQADAADIAKQWDRIERGMGGQDPTVVAQRRDMFYAQRGYAPSADMGAMQEALRTKVNPLTGKPLTRDDIEDFNIAWPKSKVPMPEFIGGATGSWKPQLPNTGGASGRW